MSETTTTTPIPAECTGDCIYYCIGGMATLFYSDCGGVGCGCVDTYTDSSCGSSGRYVFISCAPTTTTTTTTTTTPDPNTSTSTTTTTPVPTTSTSTTTTTTTQSPCGYEPCIWTWTNSGWALRYQIDPCSELGCGQCPEPPYPCEGEIPEIGTIAITYCVATTTTTRAPTTTTTSTTTTLGPTTTTTLCVGCGYRWDDAWYQVYNRCSGRCVCPHEYLPTDGVKNEIFELPCLTLGTPTTPSPCGGRCKWQWRIATGQWTRMTNPCDATCPCPPPTAAGTEDCQIVETYCTPTTTTTTTTQAPCTGGCTYICTGGVYVLTSPGCGGGCVCPDVSCWTCTGNMEGNDAWAACVHTGENPWCTTTTQSPCTGKCVYSCNNMVWTLTGRFCSGSGCGCNPQPGSGHYCGAGTGTLETECIATTTTTPAPCEGVCTWTWQVDTGSFQASGAVTGNLVQVNTIAYIIYDASQNAYYYVFWMPYSPNNPYVPFGWYVQPDNLAAPYVFLGLMPGEEGLAKPYWRGPTSGTPVGTYRSSGGFDDIHITTRETNSHWVLSTNPCTQECPCSEPSFAGVTNGQTASTACGSAERCWPTVSLEDFVDIDLDGFATLPFCGSSERFWSTLALSDFADSDISAFAILPL